jgi:hypothetical protein
MRPDQTGAFRFGLDPVSVHCSASIEIMEMLAGRLLLASVAIRARSLAPPEKRLRSE